MIKCVILISTLLIIFTKITPAQNNTELNRKVIEDATENTVEELSEGGQNEIPSELMDLFNHPLNLNNENCEILVRLNLITQTQLSALEEYLIKMGSLVELEELQQLKSFDKKTIENIIPYCTIISFNKIDRSFQFTLRVQRSKNKFEENYPGSEYKILIKYKSILSSKLSISYTGEKDAGEEIFTREKKGFDFNSFNITYTGKKLIKKIIVGDYNIEYGQGLTAWTGLSYGSGVNITGIYKYGRGIVPYSGTDENRFFRGLATTIEKNKFRYEIWMSYHAIDGNMEIDKTSNEEYISSFQNSGYHRTPSEIQNRHSQKETAFGTAINYSSVNLTTGIVVSGQHYKTSIKKNKLAYNIYEFKGNDNLNIGWNYSFAFRNILFFGEVAYNKTNSFALLNGAIMSIDPRLSIGLLWRSYSSKYSSLKSNAFGVNSKTTSEKGKYFGVIYKLTRKLIYSGYLDIHSFPYLKFRVDKPSIGFDFFHQVEFTPTKTFTTQIRYRKKLKQLNDETINSKHNDLSDYIFNSIRISARFKLDNTWEYSFRVEFTSANKNNKNTSNGTLVSQDLFFHPMGKSYSANCRYAIFNCPQFDTRIYEYENDVQGAFSLPFYYGTGSRFYTNLNYKIKNAITISLRHAISWINEGFSSIENSEIKLQLKTIIR